MAIEIEKKFRLTKKQFSELSGRLESLGAEKVRNDFEVNTLYTGESLDTDRAVLRLRRLGDRALLTYKERFRSDSDIKQQQEDETAVDNADAMESILDAIGFFPAVVYEKRRETWRMGGTEIVLDELPFGLFMEIEGEESAIQQVERTLGIKGLKAESATYPQLARKHGVNYGGVIEARFPEQ